MQPANNLLSSWSLRRQLLVGILLPVLLFIVFHSISAYRESLQSLHTAYDRTLLASAKSIGEQLIVTGYEEYADIRATVPYSALEIFEADNQSRLFYRVSTLDGHMVSGFAELPMWKGRIPERPPYAALVDFYDGEFRQEPVRIAVLLQPVAGAEGRGMAVIQVAETLELRHAMALQLLQQSLWRQALLIVLVVLTVLVVVQRVTRPVRQLSQAVTARPEGDLSALQPTTVPIELQPLLQATNQLMERMRNLLSQQKRFVRDASHQLRTPLAVLTTQVQSAQRGDVSSDIALAEIAATVQRATRLANQLLSLAKVEQLRQQAIPTQPILWNAIVREVALDLAPLTAEKDLDVEVQADEEVYVRAEDWMLRELTRNLLHNAIRHSPPQGKLRVTLSPKGSINYPTDTAHSSTADLCIDDDGPGLDPALHERLFQPFGASHSPGGSGLGLAICYEIVQALKGNICLSERSNTKRSGQSGLSVHVRLPTSNLVNSQKVAMLSKTDFMQGKIRP